MTPSTIQDAEATRSALLAFAGLNLTAWHGLPEHCSVLEARRIFKLDDAIEGRSTLGAEGKPASFQSLDDRPLRNGKGGILWCCSTMRGRSRP